MDDIETLVAIGDSVIWGQGLQHEQKFVTRVFEILSDGERLPERNIKAHSGAVIGIDRTDPSAPRFRQLRDVELEFGPIGTRTGRHDKPNAGLTILQQLDRLPYDYFDHDGPGDDLEREADRAYEHEDDVDIVILDGGINDIGVFSVGLDFGDRADFDRRIRRHCYEDLSVLIARTRRKFPNAVIVVTSYFPYLSFESEVNLEEAITMLSAVVAVLFGLPMGVAARLFGGSVRRTIIKNVLRFNRLQLTSIRRAVTEASRELGGPGVVFATPRLRGVNAPNAPQAWLWPILEADDIVPTGAVGDPAVAAQRVAVCEATDSGIACQHAATAHPNPVGANVYAGMILERLGQHRESTLREPLSRLQGGATDAPVSVREQTDRYGLEVAPGLRTELVHTTVDSLTIEMESRLKGKISTVMVSLGGEAFPIGLRLPAVSPNVFTKWRIDRIPIDPIFATNRLAVNPIRLWELEDLRVWAEPLSRFPGMVGPSGPSGDHVKNANVETVLEVSHFALSINGVQVYADDNRRTLPAGEELRLPYPSPEQ